MKSNTWSSYLVTIVLLFSAMLVSGCSGSSDSPLPTDSDDSAFDDAALDTGDVDSLDEGADGSDGSDSSDVIETDSSSIEMTDEAVNDTSGASEDGSVNTNPVVPDPLAQTRTQVQFEIMVPAYQSNELRVVLDWGEFDFNAQWVGDQFWSASADLPTNTEHALNVTFYDLNGDIELARASQQYRTGANAAETFAVGVEQFDASLFDTDEDGINNLDELIAGSDPFIDEDSLLPIEDFTPTTVLFAWDFEAYLTEERPLFVTFAPHPNNPKQDSLSGNLDIDADGNGVLMNNANPNLDYRNTSGTRTHSENSVSWEGVINSYDGSDYTATQNVTNTVTLVDEYTRRYVEESDGGAFGTYQFTGNRSSDLIGKLIDDASVCEPVAGTHFEMSFNGVRRTRTETSISKEIDDPYWRVVEVTNFVREENRIETTEYFAREFKFRSFRKSLGGFQEVIGFPCDFVDFQP